LTLEVEESVNPHVTSVRALDDYELEVSFENGERRIFDVKPFLSRGIFGRLRDRALFQAAQTVAGSVEWPGGLDLSYDTLYLESQPIAESIDSVSESYAKSSYTSMELASRNESQGFADRTRNNLLFVEAAYESGHDVHVVTQIVTSSLGLVVFPWEHEADVKIRRTLLSTLVLSNWPKWEETEPSKGLGQLIHRLRNAIAHGKVRFSSEDREASNVIITFGSNSAAWQAKISARDLRDFCLRFIELIHHAIG
jgi:hypothetical protein